MIWGKFGWEKKTDIFSICLVSFVVPLKTTGNKWETVDFRHLYRSYCMFDLSVSTITSHAIKLLGKKYMSS